MTTIKYLEKGIEVGGEFISLIDITNSCNSAKIKKEKLVLLKIKWGRRNADIVETKAYPIKTAKRVKEMLIGKNVYFGEIEGKHSDVYGEMGEYDFEIITSSKTTKDFLLSVPSGWDFNHSFLDAYAEQIQDDYDGDITEDFIKEYLEIY